MVRGGRPLQPKYWLEARMHSPHFLFDSDSDSGLKSDTDS